MRVFRDEQIGDGRQLCGSCESKGKKIYCGKGKEEKHCDTAAGWGEAKRCLHRKGKQRKYGTKINTNSKDKLRVDIQLSFLSGMRTQTTKKENYEEKEKGTYKVKYENINSRLSWKPNSVYKK